ncbi:MAG: rod shape-determining protein MreC [Paludibacteraceae bacterium]|nr:rod shape-determining protein MreC [Paludibacteraceae bacterium]
MRNLLGIIVRYSHFLLFLLLEAVALWLVTHYQSYSQASVLTSSNSIIAGIHETEDNIGSFFRLHKDNELLNNEICRLQLEIQTLHNQLENVQEDSGYCVIPAKVIDLATNQTHNYLVVNKGRRDSITPGMGVVCGENIIGVVSKVNERFAQVIPLIHPRLNISARIKNNNQIGFTHWSGPSSTHVDLMEIGRHISVTEGDTIITSGMTATFPEGLMIGVVDKVDLDGGDNYYTIRLKLSADYKSLRYVQILDNPIRNALDSLQHE